MREGERKRKEAGEMARSHTLRPMKLSTMPWTCCASDISLISSYLIEPHRPRMLRNSW